MILKRISIFFKSGREVSITPTYSKEMDDFRDAFFRQRKGTNGIFQFTDLKPDNDSIIIVLDEVEFFVEKNIVDESDVNEH